jgi:Ulp1 family protease
MDKKKKPIDLSDWEDYHDPVSITNGHWLSVTKSATHSQKGPQQLNGSDCGVFACQTMEHRARGVGDKGDDVTETTAWEFEQKHMVGIRNLMRWELIKAEIAKRGE